MRKYMSPFIHYKLLTSECLRAWRGSVGKEMKGGGKLIHRFIEKSPLITFTTSPTNKIKYFHIFIIFYCIIPKKNYTAENFSHFYDVFMVILYYDESFSSFYVDFC